MGSYGSQSVASIGALMAREAELKAAKSNEHTKNEEYLIAVYLPRDLIEREVNQSFELVEEDLKTIHQACIKTWSLINESD